MTRRNLHEVVEETLWQTRIATDDRDFFECQSCGAVVLSQYTHAEWHEEMDAR